MASWLFPWPMATLMLAAAVPGALGMQSMEPQVRVLILEAESLPLAAQQQPLVLRIGDQRLALAAGEEVLLRLAEGELVLERGGGVERLQAAREIWLEPASRPAEGGDFQLKQRGYRGRLQVLVGGSGLRAINHVGLESYLSSVVGSEMPASWPQAALRAQAVAARTYALRQRKPADPFDLSATVSSQVYKGVDAETPSTREAVLSTRGQVLMYGSSLANAVFHSSSGGATENSGDLWSQQLPYLVSVPDFDQASPVQAWQQRLEPEQLQQACAEIGGAQRIDVLSTTSTGRVRQARVSGPSGTLVVSGAQLRSRLGLRSTMVRFELAASELAALPPLPLLPEQYEVGGFQPQVQLPLPSLLAVGRGYGHGVGMSQWGALGLAQRGQSYDQILRHYYRGTELRPYASP